MRSRDLKAYAERPWSAAKLAKREHWAREVARPGSRAAFEAAQALWLHMRMLRPEWPSEEERAADLEHHVAQKRALDRAAGGRPDRAAR